MKWIGLDIKLKHLIRRDNFKLSQVIRIINEKGFLKILKITAVIPVRKGSQRVKNKSIRKFIKRITYLQNRKIKN